MSITKFFEVNNLSAEDDDQRLGVALFQFVLICSLLICINFITDIYINLSAKCCLHFG